MHADVMITPCGSVECGRLRSMYSRPAGDASSNMYKNLNKVRLRATGIDAFGMIYEMSSRYLESAAATS